MLQVNHIDHLNVSVKNFDETIEFYNKVFGLEVREKGLSGQGNDYVIIGKQDQFYLCLYENEVKDVDGGFISHFGVNIKNFDDILKNKDELNLDIQYGGAVDYGNTQSIYIKDPSGIEIELSKHFGGLVD